MLFSSVEHAQNIENYLDFIMKINFKILISLQIQSKPKWTYMKDNQLNLWMSYKFKTIIGSNGNKIIN